MDKKDYIYKDFLINNKYNINKNEEKINYFKTTNFSDLFSYRNQQKTDVDLQLVYFLEQFMSSKKYTVADLRKALIKQASSSINLNSFLKLQSALDYIERNEKVISSQQMVRPQGTQYDASRMWSPIGSAGVVYQWNRGVIGISYDGKIETENLDRTFGHHADATVKISRYLGVAIPMTTMPFQAGVDAKDNGILLLQLEGDNCLVYFPDNITDVQLNELIKILSPRQKFTFSFVYKDEMFENQNVQSLLLYAANFVSQLRQPMR